LIRLNKMKPALLATSSNDLIDVSQTSANDNLPTTSSPSPRKVKLLINS
jgi:hypothetical protein